jgi:hypothetical protein
VQDSDAIPFPVLARLFYSHFHHVVLLYQSADFLPLCRTVTQFHFLSCPDSSIPTSTTWSVNQLIFSHVQDSDAIPFPVLARLSLTANQLIFVHVQDCDAIPFPVLARLLHSHLHHVVFLSISCFVPMRRTVTQFHFLSWPDSSIPTSTKALLEFRR